MVDRLPLPNQRSYDVIYSAKLLGGQIDALPALTSDNFVFFLRLFGVIDFLFQRARAKLSTAVADIRRFCEFFTDFFLKILAVLKAGHFADTAILLSMPGVGFHAQFAA
jgi:hypothetical protein